MTIFTPDPKKPIVWNWINSDLEINAHEIGSAIEHEESIEWTDRNLGVGATSVGVLSAVAGVAFAGVGFAMVGPIALALVGTLHMYNSGIMRSRRRKEGEFLSVHPNVLKAIEAKLNQGEEPSTVASAYEAVFRAYRRGENAESIAKTLSQTKSQQAFQPTNGQNPVFAHTPIGVPAVTELQPIAAAPSYTSPNLAPPKTRAELMARLKTDGAEVHFAIETGLRGKFQLLVRKDMKLTWPRAETPTHWMVMGLNPNLEEAMKIAVRETIDFITARFPHLTRQEAYMIASVAVDYHVTQVVDGTKGVHGMIPKAIFTGR